MFYVYSLPLSCSFQAITGLISQAEVCITQLHQELFPQQGAGEVIGPRHPLSSSSSDISAENRALYNTLASLANGEDSGEESTGMQSEAASEAGDSDVTSASNSNKFTSASSVVSNREGTAQSPQRLHGSVGVGGSGSGVVGGVVGRTSDTSGVGSGVSEPPVGNRGGEAEGAGTSTTPVAAAGGESFVNVPLLQQMQTALRTWEYLHTNAHTPSTVLRGGAGGNGDAMEM